MVHITAILTGIPWYNYSRSIFLLISTGSHRDPLTKILGGWGRGVPIGVYDFMKHIFLYHKRTLDTHRRVHEI